MGETKAWLLDPTVPPPGLARAPQAVDISLTGRCNLSCRYCFFAGEMAGLSDLPTERWLALFEELGGLAVQRVTLSGGEVFTRPDLWELVDGLVASRLRYSILSNGTLITEKTIAAFGEGKRRLRLDSIQVSIDGSRAEIHDKSRPPHSFDAALRGLRLLKEAGFPVTVRVTVNAHNVEDLPAIAELLLEDVGLAGFSTNEAEQMGTARCLGESIMLSREQRLRAMDLLTGLNERYGGCIGASAGPLAAAGFFAEIDDGPRPRRDGVSRPRHALLLRRRLLQDGRAARRHHGALQHAAAAHHGHGRHARAAGGLAAPPVDQRPAAAAQHPVQRAAGVRGLRVHRLLRRRLPGRRHGPHGPAQRRRHRVLLPQSRR